MAVSINITSNMQLLDHLTDILLLTNRFEDSNISTT